MRRYFLVQQGMNLDPIVIVAGDAPETEAFLADRIYEFNSTTAGYFDGESFSATRRAPSGTIRGGISGYTWGGCCYISYLWVDETERGNGMGTALLLAAEQHASLRRCAVVFLASHSFQAPAFYERMGYEMQGCLRDHPVGHASFSFAKRLRQVDD
jgi:GNAT superfamily N-acetyltransferase